MSSSDHLIERAAALLQGAIRPALPLDGPLRPAGPAQDAQPRGDAEVDDLPPPVSRAFVPLPQAKPSLVQSPQPPLALATGAPLAPATLGLPAGPAALQPPPQPAPSQPALPQHAPIGYDRLQAAGLVMARGSRSRISEEYRIVLGRVLRALREELDGRGGANLLMVTSAKPGEGKSFTALNLAGSIAQHTTEKVLLVDLDAKVRPLTALLGTGDLPGFYDLVANSLLDPAGAMLPTAVANLHFLPVGHRTDETDGQADGRPITATIGRIARQFADHVVVLDAPPCLSTSDPSTVAAVVGQIVMVIEAERTQRSEVEAALDLVRVCPNITMLLNKVQLTSSHTFGAYDYYGTYS
jgi:protein-tyrosine kinase